ncbi:MAG: dihydroorotase [Flavobacteriales bacterium]|nr:dihydroorotase [Flavobacteriales bacterium]
MDMYLIKNATIINEHRRMEGDVLVKDGIIEKIAQSISHPTATIIEAEGQWLLPGVIDDQVHFREPGLTHKANIYTEAKAAVAGGITSFMEMPNTKPQAVTQELLEQKYQIGAQSSLANYSFFMGTTNNNYDELMRTDPKKVCGIKIFMGSSTGDMLVDDDHVLSKIFANAPTIIALHCEDEQTIKTNTQQYIDKYGDEIPFSAHPEIRNSHACYLSSSKAVELAKKHDTRIHILHISTAEEIALFTTEENFKNKKITSEVCVHHLSFNADDYATLGSKIKCNPAIKYKTDQEALWNALREGKFDVIATDHAPHTAEEKAGKYLNAPSGLPLVQHSLQLMLQHARDGRISVEEVVNRMCHKPAELFNIEKRGFVREGYFADLVLVNPMKSMVVEKDNILYKCGWSPLEGRRFDFVITNTFVSGHWVYRNGIFDESRMGQRLSFNR